MNTKLQALLFVAILITTGCISAPPYEGPPETALNHEWTLQDDATEQTIDFASEQSLEHWWEAYDDAALTRLVEEGLSHNQDVRYAVLRIEEAQAILSGAQSGLWPVANLEGSMTRSRTSESTTYMNDIYRTVNNVGVGAAWEIDLFKRIRHHIAAEQARFEMLQEDAHAVALSTTGEIARSYFSLRSAQNELSAQQNIITSLENLRGIVARRVQSGDLPEADIQVIDARLVSARASIPEIDARIRIYALALSLLTGGLPEKELELTNNAEPQLSFPAIPVGARADILRRRPDIRSAERQLAASYADTAAAVAEQFPQLTINAMGGFEALSSGSLVQAANRTWSIFPFISWRILDGGRIRADIHTAEARQKMAALAYEQAVLTALNEAETSMNNYYYQNRSLQHWQNAAAATQQVLHSQQRRFNAGDVAMADVLEAQQQFAEAQYSLAITQGNTANALVDVIKALGGGM